MKKRFMLWIWWLRYGRESLDLAWGRIEAQEKLVSDLQRQIDDFRKVLAVREEPKPAPVKARNWRAVQEFVGEPIDAR
jgi:hypothetical protein